MLGHLLALTLAGRRQQIAQPHLGRKDAGMVGPGCRDQLVARGHAEVRLAPFLQPGLEITVEVLAQDGRHGCLEQRLQKEPHGIGALVEIQRPQQRFERVGQNIRARATGFGLALPQAQFARQASRVGKAGQARRPHQGRPHPSQPAFFELREALEEPGASDKIEDRIAQKLKTFVVARPRSG